ncbi:MAG: hypothetical protein K0R65_2837 [Crocinitomicaceae bacterium]|jgi:hypothetical protein|nr:hypothetical protein [Crocinitomicaceae bacterium]
MTTVLINSQKVKDFKQWHEAFAANTPMREQAGIKIRGVYQSVEDQNMVTVISEVPGVEQARTILSNMKEMMEKSGVESTDSKIVIEIN